VPEQIGPITMTKNTLKFLMLFILTLYIGSASCRKKEVTATPFTNMLGTWLLTQTAFGDNGSASNPIFSPVEKGQKYYKVFFSDSTGKDSDIYNGVLDPVAYYNWQIIKNDSVYINYHANTTAVYSIYEVNSSNLILLTTDITDSGVSVPVFTYYQKI